MDAMTAILQRRSVRRFTSDTVEPRKIEAILEAARWAPSGGNTQPWDFVVVNDSDIRRKLAALLKLAHLQHWTEVMATPHDEKVLADKVDMADKLARGPIFIVVCLNRKRGYTTSKYAEFGYFLDLQSVAAAIENMLLAATAQGLGSVWMGTPRLKQPEMKELLGIPESVEIVAVVTLGYPAEEAGPRSRDTLESMVHYNRW